MKYIGLSVSWSSNSWWNFVCLFWCQGDFVAGKYKCLLCEKEFISESGVKYHINSVHAEVRQAEGNLTLQTVGGGKSVWRRKCWKCAMFYFLLAHRWVLKLSWSYVLVWGASIVSCHLPCPKMLLLLCSALQHFLCLQLGKNQIWILWDRVTPEETHQRTEHG